MFLKRIRSRKGRQQTYWALVRSVRTARGPRHQIVSYLGGLTASERAGWAKLNAALSRPAAPWLSGANPEEEAVPETVEVYVRKVRVERTRDFGDVYLGLCLWRALGLDELLGELLPSDRETIGWSLTAAILALARFCVPSSELHIADYWYAHTALDDLLGVPAEMVNKDRLYRTLDRVLPLKPEIERHLKERFTTLFDAQYDLLLYDVTSTYFEGEAAANPQAQRGYSRDGRPDCKQVCIGLVVTREGLPVGYKVFDGNRTDVTTVEDIVSTMEALHGCIDRIWVMDRGMVSEDNLTWLRTEGRRYIVGTPKAWLRRFERPLLEEGWTEVQPGVEVKCCPAPEGAETFILCRSEARREKERAMHARFEQRLEAGLKKLAGRLDRAKRKPDRAQVERQIGRLLARNSRAAALFEVRTVEVERDGRKGHLKLEWNKREEHRQWWALSEGAYLLRTNLPDWPAEELWRSYIHLTQVESAFRVEKSDLSLRPIWHQLEHRVQAHVLFSYLAYAMWKTLELWMARSDLGNSPRMLLEELARIKSQDVILPTSAGRDVRVRCVRKPDDSQELLLDRLGLQLPLRVSEPRWCK